MGVLCSTPNKQLNLYVEFPFQGFGCSKKLNYLHRPFNQRLLIFQTFFTNICQTNYTTSLKNQTIFTDRLGSN